MTGLLAALPDLKTICLCRTTWALAVGALALWLALPQRMRYGKTLGGALGMASLGLFASDWPLLSNWTDQGVFWLLALITLVPAVATITSQSPVYSAIWFALSLLGTAGLFFLNGAQFLGVATVVVYAGAIVVTFLFVIMLAQPEGHSSYDRMSWGSFPRVASVLAAAALVGVLTMMLGGLKSQAAKGPTAESAAQVAEQLTKSSGILAKEHVATLGQELFSKHLISVEVAGTLLLAALVGAVAIAIQGKPKLQERLEEAARQNEPRAEAAP